MSKDRFQAAPVASLAVSPDRGLLLSPGAIYLDLLEGHTVDYQGVFIKNFSRENSNNFVSTNLKKEHCH